VLRTIVDLDRARRLNLCYQVSDAGSQKKETSLLQEMRDRGQGAPGNGRIHLKVSELGKREVVPARLARVRSKLTSPWQTPLYFVEAGRDKDITSNQPIPETPLQSQRGALHPARRSVARSASKRRRKHSLRRMRQPHGELLAHEEIPCWRRTLCAQYAVHNVRRGCSLRPQCPSTCSSHSAVRKWLWNLSPGQKNVLAAEAATDRWQLGTSYEFEQSETWRIARSWKFGDLSRHFYSYLSRQVVVRGMHRATIFLFYHLKRPNHIPHYRSSVFGTFKAKLKGINSFEHVPLSDMQLHTAWFNRSKRSSSWNDAMGVKKDAL